MSAISKYDPGLPPEQQAICDRCFHPTGKFIEFKDEAVERSIPSLFEEQVRKYPDRLAVKSEGQELTYGQLNRAANQVAQTILAECGESSEPVVLLFEHGLQMVVALLGILKTRKFFVAIDASHPTNRNRPPAVAPAGIILAVIAVMAAAIYYDIWRRRDRYI